MLLRRILQQTNEANVIAARVDVEAWSKAIPSAEKSPLLSALPRTAQVRATDSETGFVERLRFMTARDAGEALQDHVVRLVAAVMHSVPERIPLQKPLRTLGLDSLMGLEVRNKLEISLKLRLPASVIWNYPTVEKLAAHLYHRLDLGKKESGPPVASNGIHKSRAFDLLAKEIEQAEELLSGD